MSKFDVLPITRFATSSATIRRPKEITCFSYDDQHQYHPDERSLCYYYPPYLGADLSKGFDSFQKLDDTGDDHLESLLKSIVDLEQRTGTKCEADIITWRGMMTKIMTAPFENRDGFEMNATMFQETIFIEENHIYKLQSKMAQQAQPSQPGVPSQDLMSYWGTFKPPWNPPTIGLISSSGYKFEILSVLPDQWDSTSREYIENREVLVVNNHAQYCSVVKTGIGKAKMIIGGEVDAIWDCKPETKDIPINWVELKTSAEIEKHQDSVNFERKLLKFWAQSFLLGVPKIIVGFRSKHGILQRLEELETKNIPGIVKQRGKGSWDGNVCINFTGSFLDYLKATITGEGVWRIIRKVKSPFIEVVKWKESGHGDILSREFIQWRTRTLKNDTQSPSIPLSNDD